MKSILFSSAALIALAGSALAQPSLEPVSNPSGMLAEKIAEKIVISATRIPTPVAEIASSVTVITAADIEARQQRSLPDILRSVPGVNIVQTGGAGGQTDRKSTRLNPSH